DAGRVHHGARHRHPERDHLQGGPGGAEQLRRLRGAADHGGASRDPGPGAARRLQPAHGRRGRAWRTPDPARALQRHLRRDGKAHPAPAHPRSAQGVSVAGSRPGLPRPGPPRDPAPRAHDPASSRTGVLLLATVVLAWSFTWPVNKVLLQSLTPFSLMAVRAALAPVALFALALATGRLQRPPRADLPVLLSISLLHMVGFAVLGAWGLQLVPTGRSVVLAYTTPLWVT